VKPVLRRKYSCQLIANFILSAICMFLKSALFFRKCCESLLSAYIIYRVYTVVANIVLFIKQIAQQRIEWATIRFGCLGPCFDLIKLLVWYGSVFILSSFFFTILYSLFFLASCLRRGCKSDNR